MAEFTYKRQGFLFPGGPCWRKTVYLIFIAGFLFIIFTDTISKIEIEVEIELPTQICPDHPMDQYYAAKTKPQEFSPPMSNLESDDYRQLIDLKNFTFIIKHENKCAHSSVFLLMLISSAPQNQDLRNAIRSTWGKENGTIKTVFLLGAVGDDQLRKSIVEEDEENGDIIQGNFEDSYTNLSYKTIMALKYAVYHCPNAVYSLKLDDDVFVNIPLMKNYLNNDISPFGARKLLQCIVLSGKKPIREPYTKWSVSEELYPEEYYPTYCQGPHVLLSPDVVFNLYREAQKLPYFYLEDVFTYGLAARNVEGLNHSTFLRYWLGYYPPSDIKTGAFDKRIFLFGTVSMTDEDIKVYWDYVNKKPVPSSVCESEQTNHSKD